VNCPACGQPMREFNRIYVFVCGIVWFAVAVGFTRMGPLMYLSPLLGLMGIFFLIWATFGRGLWCRTCKTFPMSWKIDK